MGEYIIAGVKADGTYCLVSSDIEERDLTNPRYNDPTRWDSIKVTRYDKAEAEKQIEEFYTAMMVVTHLSDISEAQKSVQLYAVKISDIEGTGPASFRFEVEINA